MESLGPTLRERLIDITIGSAEDHCDVPTEPVTFGQRYWLAQHRWLEPVIGIVTLVPIGLIYALGFEVLTSTAAWALMGVWSLFVVGGIVLRVLRPCTVLRLPIHALLVWILVIATAGVTGIKGS
jgi:hypothetical protein